MNYINRASGCGLWQNLYMVDLGVLSFDQKSCSTHSPHRHFERVVRPEHSVC